MSSLVFVTLLVHCKSEDPIQIKINQKHKEIMSIHDEVMPKMKDIYSLKKQLKKVEDKDQVVDLLSALENADDAMMDWMAQYKKPKKDVINYESYLADQQKAVTKVREEMLSAISQAQTYLQ